MADEKKWVAKRGFDYGGRHLDRGQVFTLAGARNDEKLERLGYITKLRRTDPLATCGPCQERFVGDAERNAHARFRHQEELAVAASEDVIRRVNQLAGQLVRRSAGEEHTTISQGEAIGRVLELHPDLRRDYTAAIEATRRQEAHAEREERIAEETAPLKLDKTAATLTGKAPARRGTEARRSRSRARAH